MRQKYVPLEKRSKKQQREFHSMQRKDWGNINPITKKVPNAKVYDRKKARRWDSEYEPLSGFIIYNTENNGYNAIKLTKDLKGAKLC